MTRSQSEDDAGSPSVLLEGMEHASVMEVVEVYNTLEKIVEEEKLARRFKPQAVPPEIMKILHDNEMIDRDAALEASINDVAKHSEEMVNIEAKLKNWRDEQRPNRRRVEIFNDIPQTTLCFIRNMFYYIASLTVQNDDFYDESWEWWKAPEVRSSYDQLGFEWKAVLQGSTIDSTEREIHTRETYYKEVTWWQAPEYVHAFQTEKNNPDSQRWTTPEFFEEFQSTGVVPGIDELSPEEASYRETFYKEKSPVIRKWAAATETDLHLCSEEEEAQRIFYYTHGSWWAQDLHIAMFEIQGKSSNFALYRVENPEFVWWMAPIYVEDYWKAESEGLINHPSDQQTKWYESHSWVCEKNFKNFLNGSEEWFNGVEEGSPAYYERLEYFSNRITDTELEDRCRWVKETRKRFLKMKKEDLAEYLKAINEDDPATPTMQEAIVSQLPDPFDFCDILPLLSRFEFIIPLSQEELHHQAEQHVLRLRSEELLAAEEEAYFLANLQPDNAE
eukprot:TRINITY_DN2984_c2_g1_i1.p1 TRINITY_DN2984_c2_g1~~TRINITY_DN2984_c2_g1_i1.p1  ORF type:complete len:519 (+),score=78.27 TRINITY_DN2984_c2_g1_i1:51-1559(+)